MPDPSRVIATARRFAGPPPCPNGCECRWRYDADRYECACDGPCCLEEWDDLEDGTMRPESWNEANDVLGTELWDALTEYDTTPEPKMVFTHVADDFWDVNDSATVAKSALGTWAYCHPGSDGWVTGFDSREAAGQAALDAIREAQS